MESKHCWYRFKFTNEISNIAFRNVHGMSFRNDTTFITTMRALVTPRMESTDDLKYSSMDFSQNECNSAGARKYLIELMMRCLRNIKMANNVVYMCLGARNDLNEEQLSNYDLTMHDIESTLKKVLLGYTRESKLSARTGRMALIILLNLIFKSCYRGTSKALPSTNKRNSSCRVCFCSMVSSNTQASKRLSGNPCRLEVEIIYDRLEKHTCQMRDDIRCCRFRSVPN